MVHNFLIPNNISLTLIPSQRERKYPPLPLGEGWGEGRTKIYEQIRLNNKFPLIDNLPFE